MTDRNPLERLADNIGANRIVLALSIARLGDAVGNSVVFVVVPLYVAQLPAPWFALPDSVLVGLLISFYGFVVAFGQPLIGAIADRLHHRKPLILAGLVLMGASTLAFAVASRFSHLLVIRALQGLGVALTVPAALAIMATATEQRTRGGSMGIYSSLRMAGLAIGPLIGGYLRDVYNFEIAFFAGTAAILLGIIVVQLWVHEIPADVSQTRQEPFRIIDPRFLSVEMIGLAAATFVMAVSFTMMSALENEFTNRLNVGAFGFGLAFSALTVTRLLTQVPLGRLSDRIGRKPFVIGGLIMMAPATAVMGLVGSTAQLAGVRLVQGLASGAIAAPGFALAADLSRGGGEGRQMSILTMGFGLGIAIGPLIAGTLAVVSFQLPFFVGAVMSLLVAWGVSHFVPESVAGADQRHKEERY